MYFWWKLNVVVLLSIVLLQCKAENDSPQSFKRKNLTGEQAFSVAKVLILPVNDPLRVSTLEKLGVVGDNLEGTLYDWFSSTKTTTPGIITTETNTYLPETHLYKTDKVAERHELSERLAYAGPWFEYKPHSGNNYEADDDRYTKLQRFNNKAPKYVDYRHTTSLTSPTMTSPTTTSPTTNSPTTTSPTTTSPTTTSQTTSRFRAIETFAPMVFLSPFPVNPRNNTLTPEDGLDIAKALILPVNDIVRHDVLKSHGLDSSAEELIQDWYNKDVNRNHTTQSQTQQEVQSTDSTTRITPKRNRNTKTNTHVTTVFKNGVVTPNYRAVHHDNTLSVKEIMKQNNVGYISGLIIELCRIMKKKGMLFAKMLVSGANTVIHELVENNFFNDIGSITLKALLNWIEEINSMPAEELNALADRAMEMFLHHSNFEPDTQEIIEELERWFTNDEGDELLSKLTTLNVPTDETNITKRVKDLIYALLNTLYRLSYESSVTKHHILNLIETALKKQSVNRNKYKGKQITQKMRLVVLKNQILESEEKIDTAQRRVMNTPCKYMQEIGTERNNMDERGTFDYDGQDFIVGKYGTYRQNGLGLRRIINDFSVNDDPSKTIQKRTKENEEYNPKHNNKLNSNHKPLKIFVNKIYKQLTDKLKQNQTENIRQTSKTENKKSYRKINTNGIENSTSKKPEKYDYEQKEIKQFINKIYKKLSKELNNTKDENNLNKNNPINHNFRTLNNNNHLQQVTSKESKETSKTVNVSSDMQMKYANNDKMKLFIDKMYKQLYKSLNKSVDKNTTQVLDTQNDEDYYSDDENKNLDENELKNAESFSSDEAKNILSENTSEESNSS